MFACLVHPTGTPNRRPLAQEESPHDQPIPHATLATAVPRRRPRRARARPQDKIRFAGNFELQHPSSVAMEKVFKPELAKRTSNQLQVDLFPAMQLGGAKENVDGVRAGTLLMTWVGMAFLSRIVPELEAVSLPFVFPNREVAFRVMDGEVGVLLDKKLADKDFISLGFMELGARQVTNSKRPIKTMDDLKGLKIRLQPNETHLATFRALGANAGGDGREGALLGAGAEGDRRAGEPLHDHPRRRFFEVQKYLSNTGHFFDFIAVVANRKKFEALTPEYQKAIREAMNAAVAYQRKLAVDTDREALAEIRKKMQYDEVPPQVREQMRKATAPVIEEIKKRAGADLVDRVVAEAGKAAKSVRPARGGRRMATKSEPAAARAARRARPRGLLGRHRGDGRDGGLVSVQVLLRYAFKNSIGWADEVSRLLFVSSIFLAIPLGMKEGAHIGIERSSRSCRRRATRWLARIAAALTSCSWRSSATRRRSRRRPVGREPAVDRHLVGAVPGAGVLGRVPQHPAPRAVPLLGRPLSAGRSNERDGPPQRESRALRRG